MAGAIALATGRGWPQQPAPPDSAAAALSVAATQELVGKLTLSEHAEQLNRLTLLADEIWVNKEKPAESDYETDQVSFYRSVYIESMQSEKGRALGPAALARQAKAIQILRRRIDAALGGGDSPGQLVNLDGEVWALGQIAAHFTWTASAAGTVAGRSAVTLHFTPLPESHPHSRIEHVLDATTGDLIVDRQTGQILRGDFQSLGEVRYGGGWLAHLAFHGVFNLQPVGNCWVIREVRVEVQGRVLFKHLHGTQINTYSLGR